MKGARAVKRIGQFTIQTEHHPFVESFAAVVGKRELEGPLGRCFDYCYEDTTLGEDTWEKAESRLQTEAVQRALQKGGLANREIDYIFAGDLLNQCISSTFGLRSLQIPFLGQYGACSTMAQTLAMATVFVESGAARRALAVTSSHFCAAERQFRYPLEYGGQRPPTAQWTVTGSGAAVVSQGNLAPKTKSTASEVSTTSGKTVEKKPVISAITVGRIADLGVKDANNMGAAMAPAAAQTLADFLSDTDTRPTDYDLIVTGDLGSVGSQLFEDLLSRHDIALGNLHQDCGKLIFDPEKQDVHAGGSGCGCAASVLCSKILSEIRQGRWRNVLFMATGALMSPTSSQQGETIPSIAHLIHLTGQ